MSTESTLTTCQNCQTTFDGKFCSNCAQKADTHRFSLLHFGHELVHAVTHTDKGILYLIKELFIRPGVVAREYVEGKRKKYFNPFTFMLVTLALQIYATKKSDIFVGFVDATEKLAMVAPAKVSADPSVEGLKEFKKQSPKLLENSKLITFLFVPIMALFSWLFFWKSGFNYAENLVLNIMIQGQTNLFFVLICIVPYLLFPASVIIVLYLLQIVIWVYSIIAYQQFYQQRKWVTIVKGSAVMILYYGCSSLITMLIIDYL